MTDSSSMFPDKIPVGISQCLLGDHVRYDGSHKHSKICTEVLAKRFEFVPVCPEVGIGMGAPREAIHLVGSLHDDAVRAIGNRTPGLDVTAELEGYGRAKAAELGELCGYIFMGRSPSCGLANIKVYHENGNPLGRSTRGIYAREFTAAHPLLPVEEEGRLRDARLCENFVARVYAWQRWHALEAGGMTQAKLQDFHARHKYLLMAHRPAAYQHLGRLVALAHQRPVADAAREYLQGFMATLQIVATNRSHANVLQHLAGYLKKLLDAQSRQELAQLIEDYRLGRVPLIAPLTLLRHHLRQHPNDYVQRQVYLEPHPPELLLRNFH
ncbi:MAG: hypothetical protein K0R03_154 [Moraxellaceae bacterium]|jgi:uncharacterized protein YbgA (DUF1722 family)/uncharacterized protein YbbK (DUF523 family)|nr:hypothetical protein [Moraxellaceae bacterium]